MQFSQHKDAVRVLDGAGLFCCKTRFQVTFAYTYMEVFTDVPEAKTYFSGRSAGVGHAALSLAEERCAAVFFRYLNCRGHDFEARGYTNGAGVCRHCGMFASGVMPPTRVCQSCGRGLWDNSRLDLEGRVYCDLHFRDRPWEVMTEFERRRTVELELLEEHAAAGTSITYGDFYEELHRRLDARGVEVSLALAVHKDLLMEGMRTGGGVSVHNEGTAEPASGGLPLD